MYLDYKCTVWRRIHFSEKQNDVDKILEDIKGGYHPDIVDAEYETLYDTSEDMTVEENGGSSTIELYDSNELLFKNGE
jgi:uncharacterized protein involved in exopolysaccharide biosynthesis